MTVFCWMTVRLLFHKYLTAVTFEVCLPPHQNSRWLTCWVRWTFRWWPAQTGPWLWGSGTQTPHSLFAGTWGYPQCTAWNVSAAGERQELVCVYVCVCHQESCDLVWCDGATAAAPWPCSYPVCVQTTWASLFLSISVHCWDHQTSQCPSAGDVKETCRAVHIKARQ